MPTFCLFSVCDMTINICIHCCIIIFIFNEFILGRETEVHPDSMETLEILDLPDHQDLLEQEWTE